ncbi:MAG: hypothetical protein Q9188_005198 [Gyalolechia gomerana]
MDSIGSVDFDVSQFGDFPALRPPPGETSNFKDPYSRGIDVVIASSICLALMLSMVLLRFYTKLFIKRIWGWDDCFAAVSISLAQKAIGPHQWNVSVAHFTDDVIRMFIVVDVIYSPAIVMAKLSLLYLYLEVFRPDKKMRYAIYFGMAFVTVCYSAFFIAYCVLAIPGPGQSLIGVMLSKDIASLLGLAIGQGAVNIASDFYIFLLPIPGVLQLQLGTKKKVGICAIFMTGSLCVRLPILEVKQILMNHRACLASVMGLYYRTKLDRSPDVTWQLVDVLIWVFLKLRSRHRASSSDSSKRLATKDIKMTLGTQVDGQGRFLNPTSVFAREEDWVKLGQAAHNPASLHRKPSGTRREWHEDMAELKRQSQTSHPSMRMSTKPSVKTHVRNLPTYDEERGDLAQEIHDRENETLTNSKRSHGSF